MNITINKQSHYYNKQYKNQNNKNNSINYTSAYVNNRNINNNQKSDTETQTNFLSGFIELINKITLNKNKLNKDNKQKEKDIELRAKKVKKEAAKELDKKKAQNAYRLVKAGCKENNKRVIHYADIMSDEQIENMCKLYKADVAGNDEWYLGSKDIDDEVINTAVKFKNAGFKEKDLILGHVIIADEIKNSEIEKAKKIKNAGFDESDCLRYSTTSITDEQIELAQQLKNNNVTGTISLRLACLNPTQEQINQLYTLINAKMNSHNAYDYVTSDLSNSEVKRIIEILAQFPKVEKRRILTFVKKNMSDSQIEMFLDLSRFYKEKEIYDAIDNGITQEQCNIAIANRLALYLEKQSMFINHNPLSFEPSNLSIEYKKEIKKAFHYIKKHNLSNFNAIKIAKPQIIANKSLQEKNDAIYSLEQVLEEKEEHNFSQEEKKEIQEAILAIKESTKHVITPLKITSAQRRELWSGFLNNNKKINETIKNANFTQFKTKGLPLEYSREEFIADLIGILENEDEVRINNILKKLEISLTPDKKGYNGIINLEKLNSDDKVERKVLAIANKFILNNSIKPTNNPELDNILNSLIKGLPEFINIIGKQQHTEQAYSVDIHILKTYQNILINPDYQKLSNQDKFCIKLTTILHDIAKEEGNIDKFHPELSAKYAEDILAQFNLDKEIRDRICNLIYNHHWFEKYNTAQNTPQYTATLLRQRGDYEISKILAKSDIEAIGNNRYLCFIDDLENKERQKPIEDSLDKINSTGLLFFPSRIIFKDRIPKETYNGREYKVINFSTIPDHLDLSSFGFSKGTTKDNIRLFIHATNKDKMETVLNLEKGTNQGLLCASYISLNNKQTYSDQLFGLSLECLNTNIANASAINQGSGGSKDLSDLSNLINKKEYREDVSNVIKNELGLSDSEYIELYRILSDKKYITQITTKSGYYIINNKKIPTQDIINAVKKANDSIIQGIQNEVNLYSPKVNAFVAKVYSLNEIPQKYLDFIHKYNLPIYLLGS